jgi:hypothetical protein
MSARRIPILQCHGDDMTLRDTLTDPLVRSVMAADNVDPDKLSAMLEKLAGTLADRHAGQPPRFGCECGASV